MATKRLRGKSWYLDWLESGTQKRRSLGPITKAEAEAQRQALALSLNAPASAAGPSFSTWAEEYGDWHSKEYPDSYFRIEQIIRMWLDPVFGSTPIGDITIKAVEAWKHARQEKAAASTVEKELRTLQAMLNLAVLWEIIPRHRIKGVKAPKDKADDIPRWYDAKDMRDIVRVAQLPHTVRKDGLKIPRRTDYSPTWALLFATGMRRGEYYNQDRRHIGREEMRIISEPTARTKSTRHRIIPLSDTARDALEQHPKRGRIAPTITPYSLSRAFTRDLERVGLDGNLHCLRHSYCSHLVAQGVHMAIVKELAGHSTIKVTEKYTHADPAQKKQAVVNL